jgi:hypothetical protein
VRTPIASALLFIAACVVASTAGPRFYDDDPISREPESQSAAGAKPLNLSLFFEYAYNLFVDDDRPPLNTRAGNINTIDEVPDSSWFANRIGAATITPEMLTRGPNAGAPPAAGHWTVLREKSAGTNPGFTARDERGQTWFLQFDVPESPEGGTGAVEVMTKLFWALGYNQIETFITTVDPAHLEIDPKATIKRPSGARTPFTQSDVDQILGRAARNPDGTYRASAGRLLTGTVLGPFRYSGTRSDDPNDLVPHENRRELRALRVFGAWTNLVDLKAGNTLDVLVDEDGRKLVKHYLQDVGSSLGMANNEHEWDMGWEYFYERDSSQRRVLTFGFGLSPWQTVPYEVYPSIGLFEGHRFDPTTWRPQTPVRAYTEMRADDAFWAARRVMAFSDDLVRAAVRTGQYSDAAAGQHLASVLIERRDAVGRAYLTAINPVINPRLDVSGALAFDNAAVDAGFATAPAGYRASWLRFDNATGTTSPIADTRSTTPSMAAPPNLQAATGTFIAIDISADDPVHASWQQPVRAYFRRTSEGWKLVGFDRLPEAPASPATTTRRP